MLLGNSFQQLFLSFSSHHMHGMLASILKAKFYKQGWKLWSGGRTPRLEIVGKSDALSRGETSLLSFGFCPAKGALITWQYILNNTIVAVNVRSSHRLCQLFSSDWYQKGTRPIWTPCKRMRSPICLYAKVALTTIPQTSLNWGRVIFTFAILKDYCGRGAEEGWRSGGLPPGKLVRTTPSTTLENVLLEHRVNIAIISNLRSQRED